MQYAAESWLFNGWHLETADGRNTTGAAVEDSGSPGVRVAHADAAAEAETQALVARHRPREAGLGMEAVGALDVAVLATEAVSGIDVERISLALVESAAAVDTVLRLGRLVHEVAVGAELEQQLLTALTEVDEADASSRTSISALVVSTDLAVASGIDALIALLLSIETAASVDVLVRNAPEYSAVSAMKTVVLAEMQPGESTQMGWGRFEMPSTTRTF